MFSILVNCARRAARVLPPLLSLPFSYSSLTFVCGAKMSNSVTGAPLFTGPPPPPPLSYQPVILPSHPPDGCYIVYVPVTMEEKLTKKKGLPRTVKTAQVRTSFFSEWRLDIQEDWSQAAHACLLVCHTACQSTVHLEAAPPHPPCQTQKQRELCGTASLKDLAIIMRYVFVFLCMSFTALSFSFSGNTVQWWQVGCF